MKACMHNCGTYILMYHRIPISQRRSKKVGHLGTIMVILFRTFFLQLEKCSSDSVTINADICFIYGKQGLGNQCPTAVKSSLACLQLGVFWKTENIGAKLSLSSYVHLVWRCIGNGRSPGCAKLLTVCSAWVELQLSSFTFFSMHLEVTRFKFITFWFSLNTPGVTASWRPSTRTVIFFLLVL